jgi:hypothetical protein
VACFATQGSGSSDEARIRVLLAELEPQVVPFAHRSPRAAAALQRTLLSAGIDIVVMEGTGAAGGLACMAAAARGVPFIVSTGDAVGPYVRALRPAAGPAAAVYERALYRACAGVIGWTPYLAGRALTLGAPRAMTAANWASHTEGEAKATRGEIRASLGIDDQSVVFGIVGTLNWVERLEYCYGAELVRAVRATRRPDVHVVVVGDGDGRAHLERLANGDARVHLPGRVPHEAVPEWLSVFDVASLPQSVDGVGSFRYTIKLSEYLNAGLPVVMGQTPASYDLDDGWLWRLPGDAPWDPRFLTALSQLMETTTPASARTRSARVPRDLPLFDRTRQQRLAAAFVADCFAAA